MNPPSGQTPLDYLNQIAPQTQKSSPFKLTIHKTLLFAGLAVVLIILLVTIVSAINSSRKGPWEQLSARLTVTQTTAETSTKKIKNSQLRSLNSDLKLYLTNTQRDLADPLTRLGIDAKKIPPSVTQKENATSMTERLEDARLNAKYDSTYAREMGYQLGTILALYQQLYQSSGNTRTKTFLKTAYDNLLPTQKALTDFSASNE